MSTSPALSKVLTISDLFAHPWLRTYLSNVRAWHGYARFLGLPDRQAAPDVLLEHVFVPPFLIGRYVRQEEDPWDWSDEAMPLLRALRDLPRLVVLADAGAGKSTLVSYLVWLLARPTGQLWRETMGPWLLPVPMVLRELALDNVRNFSGLLAAFLRHEMSEPLRQGNHLKRLLAMGRGFVLLDGLDELRNTQARAHVVAALLDGMRRFPDCRWLLTSRVLGFDERVFRDDHHGAEGSVMEAKGGAIVLDGPDDEFLAALGSREGLGGEGEPAKSKSMELRYLAPFDNEQVETFVSRWYAQRDRVSKRAQMDASSLVAALRKDDALEKLARLPALLAIMAVVHRTGAGLPDGRGLLYRRIAEAYLESIDKARGLQMDRSSLSQKMQWLARIGYEMQERRDDGEMGGEESEDVPLLVGAEDVYAWMQEVSVAAGVKSSRAEREEFLEYVGRRSGLFVPRGSGRYAFVHVSFQEYFASVAIHKEVTGIRWARGQRTTLGVERKSLGRWGGQVGWLETLLFLFELVAEREDWHRDLLGCMFEGQFVRSDGAARNRARLMGALARNPYCGMKGAAATLALATVVPFVAGELEESWGTESLLWNLLNGEGGWESTVMKAVARELRARGVRKLRVSAPTAFGVILRDVTVLVDELSSDLEILELVNVQCDLGAGSELGSLKTLYVAGERIGKLGFLRHCERLRTLDVTVGRAADLGAIEGLEELETLALRFDRKSGVQIVSELLSKAGVPAVPGSRPVRGMNKVRSAVVVEFPYRDVAFLSGLALLEELQVRGGEIRELSGLRAMGKLRKLVLAGMRVEDLTPLCALEGLETLVLDGMKGMRGGWESDVLGQLEGLRQLCVVDMEMASLEGVGRLTELEVLHLRGRDIEGAGLGVLRRLEMLRKLVLEEVPGVELGQLEGLAGLRVLYVAGPEALKKSVEGLRQRLSGCEVKFVVK